MTSAVGVADEVLGSQPPAPGDGLLPNGFHFACLAFQRARQLRNGGRSRVEAGGHKYLWVAMREVRAGMVTWVDAGEAERAV